MLFQMKSLPATLASCMCLALAGHSAFAQKAVSLPKLPPQFTLVYKVTQKDVRTPEMKQNSLKNFRETYGPQVQQGLLKQEDLDAMLKSLSDQIFKQSAPITSLVTFSGTNGKLFYQNDGSRPEGQAVLIYDGKVTSYFSANATSVGLVQTAEITPGFQHNDLSLFYNPGVSIPYIPLMKSAVAAPSPTPGVQKFQGDVPIISGGMSELTYEPGEMLTSIDQGKLKVLSVTNSNAGDVTSRMEFLHHQLLGNTWIASQMRRTIFDGAGRPLSTWDFELQKADASALPGRQFETTTWLRRNTKVEIEDAHKKWVSFGYKPNAGTLDQQAQAVRVKVQEVDAMGPMGTECKIGGTPPPFHNLDITGQPITLDNYKGKVLLLDFWATWCGPCCQEVPFLVALYKGSHAQGLEIVSISSDLLVYKDGLQAKKKVSEFTAKNQMTWPQIVDKKIAITRLYRPEGIPYNVLIGRDGKVAAVNLHGPDLVNAVQAALNIK